MELHCSKTSVFFHYGVLGFVPIWNYIVLKHGGVYFPSQYCFVPIWNYIVLKRVIRCMALIICFVPIWNYIVLKQVRHKLVA